MSDSVVQKLHRAETDRHGVHNGADEIARLREENAELLCWIGEEHLRRQDYRDALAAFELAVRRNPRHPTAYNQLAVCHARLGDRTAASGAFRQHVRLHPELATFRSRAPRQLHVVRLVDADGLSFLIHGDAPSVNVQGHWESDHFFHVEGLDVTTLHIFGDSRVEDIVARLRRLAPSVIVNTIADPDLHRRALTVAEAVCAAVDCPVVNRPARLLRHGREDIAATLQGIPGLIAPDAVRLRPAPAAARLHRVPETMRGGPLIVRVAGSQTGATMDLVEGAAALGEFLARHAEQDVYVTRFVDCRSADGYYRKYRARVVKGEIIPNHLFVGREWKVHGQKARALMAEYRWMVDEEAAFIRDMPRMIGARAVAVLEEIDARIGVDFYGIDFGIQPSGEVQFFEANATMRSVWPEWRDRFPLTWEVTQALIARFHQRILAPLVA